ncbi:MAG: glycosyltransferase family 4 protein [Candidatus Obscuribacter sp.]|nr:glycosyltransferase family 4 protein [Candidatus Obscuribacter sp.]
MAGKDRTLHLCIAGADGAIRDRLQGQVDRLGLTKRYTFVNIGAEDVAALLARALLCIQPSISESMPLAVLEAGAVGVPIAVSNIPGHDELIIDNIIGKLFKVRSPDDCARVIHGMLFDYAASSFMAQVFRERVIKSLTWDVCVKKVYGAIFLDCQALIRSLIKV